jgi:hypothetical protein
MNRYFFGALVIVAIHYSLSGIMLPDPPSHWLAPLTNDVRSVFTVLFGKLPFDERAIGLLISTVAICGLGLGLLGLFGWVVPTGWFTPSLLVGAGCSIALYLLFFNQMALIPLALNAFILWGLFGSRLVPAGNG